MHYYLTWSNIFVPKVMILLFQNLFGSLLKKFFHLVILALPFPLCLLLERQIAVIKIIWNPGCYRLKNVWYRKTVFVFLVPPIEWTGIHSVANSLRNLINMWNQAKLQCIMLAKLKFNELSKLISVNYWKLMTKFSSWVLYTY